MESFVPNKERKKLIIIKTLFYKNQAVTLEQLSEASGGSLRSVVEYLKELREEVEGLGGSLCTSSKGTRLQLPSHVGMDYFRRKLFKSAIGLQILETVFFEENLTIEDLVERFLLSKSTIDRLIRLLKKKLLPYGLGLSTEDAVRVLGPEVLIRRFYTRYFLEEYSSLEWPFELDRMEEVEKPLQRLGDFLDSDSRVVTSFENHVKLAVALEREKRGYGIDWEKIGELCEESKLVEDIVASAKERLLCTFPEEEKVYATIFSSWRELVFKEWFFRVQGDSGTFYRAYGQLNSSWKTSVKR